MARETNEQKDDKLIKRVESDYQSASDFHSKNYKENKDDTSFVYGKQWEQKLINSRKNQLRPALTENRLLQFVHQTVNSIIQSRPRIIPKPVDSYGDPDTAELLGDLIKNIENVSGADSVYGTAARNAITSGFGWIRVCTQYADKESFEQEIVLKRILDPFSVMLDPKSKELDGSDAEYAFITHELTHDELKEKYGIDPKDYRKKDKWIGKDRVMIVEYYYKEYETTKLYKDVNGVIYEKRPDKELEVEIVEQREVERCQIRYAKIFKDKVLERGDFPGQYIPVVPVYGEEAYVEDNRKIMSMIRQAKDPQKRYNYMITAQAETIALQPKSPFIGFVGQFKTKEELWRKSNLENPAFLEADIIYDKNDRVLPPPQKAPPPQGSPAIAQEAANAAEGMKAALGIYDTPLGAQSNEISGKAIIARQMQGDNAIYHFIDHLSCSMKHVGRILVDIIPVVYSDRRILRVIGADDQDYMVPVNQPVVKGQDGKSYVPSLGGEIKYDLSRGKYDVIIEIAPGYATKRQEAANALVELTRVKPDLMDIAGDILFKSLDIPHNKELVDRMRTTMNPALLGDDLEAQRLAQAQEVVNELQQRLEQTEAALLAKQEDQAIKNQIEMRKVQNEERKTANEERKTEVMALDKMSEINLDRAKINQEIPAQAAKDYADAYSKIQGQVNELAEVIEQVAEALELATGEPQSPATEREQSEND